MEQQGEKEEAKLIFQRGWKLQIRASGRGPALLLEWLARFQLEYKYVIKFRVETDSVDGDPVFIIRLTRLIVENLKEIRSYINDNA